MDEFYLEIELNAQNIALFVYFESDNIDFLASDMYFAMYPGQQRIIKLTLQQIHNQKLENIIDQLKTLQSSLQLKSLVDLR